MGTRVDNELWATRNAALGDLEVALKPESEMVQEVFQVLRLILHDLDSFFQPAPGLPLLSLLTGIKGRNLLHASYGLSLDGLAQEAGALLRPLLEAVELLVYLRTVPGAIEQGESLTLPSAGVRAKEIGGDFHKLRDHLNKHACHVNLTEESLRHLFDASAGRTRIQQPHRIDVLRQNLLSLTAFGTSLAVETSSCFSECALVSGKARHTAEAHRNKVVRLAEKAPAVFKVALD